MFRVASLRLLILAVCVCIVSEVRSELVYKVGVVGDASTIGQTSFVALTGTTLRLDLYVTQQNRFEPIPGFEFSDLRLSVDRPGEHDAGVGAYWVNVSTLDASMNAATDVVPDAVYEFGAGFIDDTGTGKTSANTLRASAFAAADLNSDIIPVTATNPTPNYIFDQPTPGLDPENSVRLGTLGINIGANAQTGDYTLQLQSEVEQFLLGRSVTAGPFLTLPSETITIRAVPEASSFGLLAVGALGFGIHQRRRRRRQPDTDAELATGA